MTRALVTMQVGNTKTSIDDVQQCWLRACCEFAVFPKPLTLWNLNAQIITVA